MSLDDLRKKLNRLDDEFKGDYDALLEAYTRLRYKHQDLKASIILFIIAGVIFVLFRSCP